MRSTLRSLHIIGSKGMGGAERFFFRLVGALPEVGIEAKALLRAGSEVEAAIPSHIPYSTSPMRTVWDPVSKFFLRQKIRVEAPHVVQTYMGRATRLTRLRKGGLPVHISRLGGYYKLSGYRHAHAWIGNTKGVCEYLKKNGFPSKRVFYVPNFIERVPDREFDQDAKKRLRKLLGLPMESWLLVTAGRFIPVKGHLYLLEAFSNLPEKVAGRTICLVILGDGPLKGEYLETISRLSPKKRVIMPGWVEDPLRYLISSDLVVFPSLGHETLGNVVLEAWSVSRPVLVTEFRGALEITEHGIDAIQTPLKDPRALKEAIFRLLSQDDLRETLSLNGLKKVRTRFSKDAVLGLYREIYEQLVQEAAGGPWV